MGTIGIYVIANLMSPAHPLDVARTFSILGYCLLPIVALAAFSILINLRGVIGEAEWGGAGWPRSLALPHLPLLLLPQGLRSGRLPWSGARRLQRASSRRPCIVRLTR